MNPRTRQWLTLGACGGLASSVIAFIFVHYFLVFNINEQNEVVDIEQTHVEQLREQFSVPELDCKQLFGEDRRYQDPRPQVECQADRAGFFFWQDQYESEEWEIFYYNQYPTRITGFMFTTNPEEVKITFKDMAGNEAEAVVEIVSDFKVCTLDNGCSRVEHVI